MLAHEAEKHREERKTVDQIVRPIFLKAIMENQIKKNLPLKDYF